MTNAMKTLTCTASLKAPVHGRLEAFLRQQTELWNAALAERIDCYRKTEKTISAYDQCRSLTIIRRDDPAYAAMRVDVQRSVLFRLDKAFQQFFARVKRGEKPGFPRFKGVRHQVRSFDVPSPVIMNGALYVKGIGRLRVRKVPDNIVSARVVKTPLRVCVQFIVEQAIEEREEGVPLGVDMGISKRVHLSDGTLMAGVRLDRRKLRKSQRKLARARRGSGTRRKKLRSLQKEHARMRLRERNALHRISASIVKKSNRIVIEDLQVRNMMKNPNLARSIAEQQWGRLALQLDYKASNAGGQVVRVDPRHTSQDCSNCGSRKTIGLGVREYACSHCGLVMDRDENAAFNILQRGIALAGWEVAPSELPGASRDVDGHVAGVPGQDAERYAAGRGLNCI